jgi:hypothetical protein
LCLLLSCCLWCGVVVQGSAVYAPEKSALVWQMRNFPGGKEYMLRWVYWKQFRTATAGGRPVPRRLP